MDLEGEEMFFFPGIGDQRILGFIHPPLRPGKSVGILYCHPFGEERNLAHASVVKTARMLAAEGFAVMRFDFSGCGDSDGELEDATVDAWLKEIALAMDEMKRKTGVEKVAYWGLRAGANLAWQAALGRGDAAFVMLWNPVAGLKTYMTQFLRQKMGTDIAAGGGKSVSVKGLVEELDSGGIVEVMGYPVSRGLYEGFLRPEYQGLPGKVPGPVLLMSIGEVDAAPASSTALFDSLCANGNRVESFHIRETPFWDRYWRWDAPGSSERTRAWAASLAS